jgi:hypothetical protein
LLSLKKVDVRVHAEIAQKIKERDNTCIVLWNEQTTHTPSPDDPYAVINSDDSTVVIMIAFIVFKLSLETIRRKRHVRSSAFLTKLD